MARLHRDLRTEFNSKHAAKCVQTDVVLALKCTNKQEFYDIWVFSFSLSISEMVAMNPLFLDAFPRHSKFLQNWAGSSGWLAWGWATHLLGKRLPCKRTFCFHMRSDRRKSRSLVLWSMTTWASWRWRSKGVWNSISGQTKNTVLENESVFIDIPHSTRITSLHSAVGCMGTSIP